MGNARHMSTDDLLKQQEKRPFKRLKTHHASRNSFSRSEDDNSSKEVESSTQISDFEDEHEEQSEHESESGPSSGSESARGLSKIRARTRGALEEDSDDGDDIEEPVSNEPVAEIPSRLGNVSVAKLEGREKSSSSPKTLKPPPPSFPSLNISTSLVSALAAMAIHTPTEVQAACIPPLIEGEKFGCKSATVELTVSKAEIALAMQRRVQGRRLHLLSLYCRSCL